MSPSWRSLSLGTCLALAACFNPSGQATATTADTSTGTTHGTGTSSDPVTSTTGDPTGPTTTTRPTATDATTAGLCGDCAPPTPYCTPAGDCVACPDLPAHATSCAALDPDKPFCDEQTGLCAACLTPADCDGGVCHPESKTCVGCVTLGDCPAPQVCDEQTGTCVQCIDDAGCLATEDAPICDGGTCRGCREHGECLTGACELDRGACFPEGLTRHLHVDAAEQCLDSICAPGLPCCSLSEAFAEIAADLSGIEHFIVHVVPGKYNSGFGLTATDRTVAVLGGPEVEIDASPLDVPIVFVGDGQNDISSKLYLSGLRITGQTAVAFGCTAAPFAALDDVEIHDVSGDAGHIAKCVTWARRSEFVRDGGGLAVDGTATLVLENSIIAGVAVQPALSVTAGAELEVNYSTIAHQSVLPNGLLWCSGGTARVRNSALLAQGGGDFVDCPDLLISHTVTTEAGLQGEGVAPVGAPLVKEPFLDWDTHNFRLAGDGNFLAGVALWTAGDPPTDIDGTKRPQVDGSADVAGAALPKRP